MNEKSQGYDTESGTFAQVSDFDVCFDETAESLCINKGKLNLLLY